MCRPALCGLWFGVSCWGSVVSQALQCYLGPFFTGVQLIKTLLCFLSQFQACAAEGEPRMPYTALENLSLTSCLLGTRFPGPWLSLRLQPPCDVAHSLGPKKSISPSCPQLLWTRNVPFPNSSSLSPQCLQGSCLQVYSFVIPLHVSHRGPLPL